MTTRQFWALAAAVFAALTPLFAQIGVAQVGADFAPFVRSCVVVVLAALLTAMGQ